MKFIRRSEYRTMPWKNGGGISEEIERVPQKEEYAWRLSRAHVAADGPFSRYLGFGRLLVVLQGEGLSLNGTTILRTGEVYRFAGEDEIDCRLIDESVWDLGLIYDRARVQAEMQVIDGPRPINLQGDVHYLFAARGDCELDGHRLHEFDTIKKEGGALFRLNKGRLVVVTVSFLDSSLRET